MPFMSADFLTSLSLILSITSPVLMPQSLAGDFIPSGVITSQIPITSTVVVFNVNPAGNPPRYSVCVSAEAHKAVEENTQMSKITNTNSVFKIFFLESITVLCATQLLIFKKTAVKIPPF